MRERERFPIHDGRMKSQAQTITDSVLKEVDHFQVEQGTFPGFYWALLLLEKPFVDLTGKGPDCGIDLNPF